MTEHSHQNPKPAVDDASQRTAMRLSARAKAAIVRRRAGVFLDADATPVIRGVAQAGGTGGAHLDQALFAARFGNRCRPEVRAQSVIIARGQRFGGLRKHCDAYHSPDSRQGLGSLDVAMLLGFRLRWPLAQLRQQRFLPHYAPLALGVGHPQPWNQQRDRLARGFVDAGRDREGRGAQGGQQVSSGQPTNPMRTQHGQHLRPRQLLLFRERRGLLEQGPEPGLVGGRTEAQHGRGDAVDLVAQLVGQPRQVALAVGLGMRKFPQLQDDRISHRDAVKGAPIGAQRVAEDVRIARVVFGTGRRKPIAKAVELFRVDRIDREAALEQRGDQRAARLFDGDGDLARRSRRSRQDPRDGAVNRRRVVLDASRVVDLAGRINEAELMRVVAPINPEKPVIVFSHRDRLRRNRPTRGVCSSLYWRSWRDSPLEVHHGPTNRGADPPPVLGAQGPVGAPDWPAELRLFGEARTRVRASKTRAWKLPELWTHRTRPRAPWKTPSARFPQLPHALVLILA